MASFVEQATLRVNDQSSAAIRKINAELKKLERTAKSLKSTTVNLRINASGLQNANKQLNTLAHNMSRLRGQTLSLRVNASGIAQAQNQIQRLRQQAAQPINVNTRGGGGGGGGAAATRRGLRQTGIQHQIGNFSVARGAASVVIGGTAYAVAANVARSAVSGVLDSEDARMRLRQSGFDKGRADKLTPDTDLIMAMARKAQEEFSRIPAAQIANASVEQLNAIKANNGTLEEYQAALRRIASNAQVMATTFKGSAEGSEAARQLERLTQALGYDVEKPTGPEAGKLQAIQQEAMRAVIATGGEMRAEEMVRVIQQLGPAVAKAMTPASLGDIMQMREEGGKASTAEWRITMQNLMRDDLNDRDKRAMARQGLRLKSGAMDPAIVNAAGENLVDFTIAKIKPIIDKAGLAAASSAEIAGYLDKEVGFTTAGARGIADIITSWRSGDIQRQRAQRAAVDLDPHLGDKTFRGGADRLSASFQTAMGRALDKSGGAFSEAIAPFAVSMDKAGKAAEAKDYAGAAWEMTKGVSGLMGGPAGAIITAMTAAGAVKTLLDPTSSTFDKGAAMLVTGSSALLTAAGAIANYFGDGDPNKDVAHLEQLKAQGPDELARLRELKAKEEAKKDPNRNILDQINARIEGAERQARIIDGEIALAKVRAATANAAADKAKADEAAAFEKLRLESTLGKGAVGPLPTAAAAAVGPVSAETVKALQQLSAGGGLAGVKSITALLAALNQPTSVKSREELAKSLGYTGPLGGSAQMNTFLLNFFKKLATAVPPETPAVTPPPPVAVEPPKDPVVVDQPIQVTPPPEAPLTPAPWQPGDLPPGARPPSFLPSIFPTAPRPFSEFIDTAPAKAEFASLFTSGASTIGNSGTQVGSNAASELSGQASGIGAIIGNAAAARISAATVNVNIPNQTAKPNTGPSAVV